jgi:hypothetical protein
VNSGFSDRNEAMDQPDRRRRIDRVAAPDLLDGVAARPTPELRSLRDDCRQEEERLSYARRVVQGQLDIARSEQERRSGGEGKDADLLSSLPRILADAPSAGARVARTVSFYTPEDDSRRSGDAVLDGPSLGQLPDLEDDELEVLIDRLEAEESQISELRHRVLVNLDGLQAELVRRYRDGIVSIDDIMGAAPSGGPSEPPAV